MINIVYLGKRGGGALLAKDLLLFGQESNLVNLGMLSSENELNGYFQGNNKITFTSVSHELRTLWKLPSNLIKQCYVSFKWASTTRDEIVLFVMPSPFDLVTMLIIRMFNRKITFICHEYKSHDGEIWPTSRAIRRRIKLSELVITLNKSDADKISKLIFEKSLIVLSHPVLDLQRSIPVIETKGTEIQHPIFLFVGRIKKYKGIERLLEAWSRTDKGFLVIAGEGRIEGTIPPRAVVINRWLSEGEIGYLMDLSDAIIFPYTSASQSGLIPLAISKELTIFVSDLEGLKAQLLNYSDRTIWIDPIGSETILGELKSYADQFIPRIKSGEIASSGPSMIAFLEDIEETWSTLQRGRDSYGCT
ncbi:MAG: hypothetical protein F2690_03565 [Actinobacteria bacterium]|uniref:Unannotated protein n=1 Tax=freshwater metagenome TaxID=449393 RepID=A0A6J5Z3C1_9ZZZZ|nr:hypothetical protein [Actinomycetota bacterium]MSX71506.1 hypothetical protein [Actinomycetota bacterium]MSY69627.1 hypothetical protein [Actinomycetota bacterium]MTA75417.1 hypothetical protein [Actinomycetota bacterium]